MPNPKPGKPDKPKREAKPVWKIKNLETGKEELLVETDDTKGKKFIPVGNAKGKNKHN